VVYPTDMRGQLYVPSVNWVLLLGCIGITLFFKESSGMEAAYGLAIIITMLSTTTLLAYYLYLRRVSFIFIIFVLVLFLTVELTFLIANLDKFPHGGWLTILIASALVFQMWGWYAARKIRNRFVEFVKAKDYLNLLRDLSHDFSIPKYDVSKVTIDRGKILKEGDDSKLRYDYTEDGISPRWFPGDNIATFLANSDEHTTKGYSSEESDELEKMMQKRMLKEKTILNDLPEPEITGDPKTADLSIKSHLPVLMADIESSYLFRKTKSRKSNFGKPSPARK
jgi:hypothetical protein